MAKKVFVGNLPYVVGDDELREGFGAYGEVVSAKVVLDRETQRPRGFGFVEFTTDEAAQAAIEGLNNQEFHGRGITVREAEDRRRGPAPGGGFGGPGVSSRPSRPPGAGPGYGGGGYRGGGDSGGYRGGGDSGGYKGGGYSGGASRPAPALDAPMAPPFDGADEPRRREKKKRKAVRGERDWDREGGGVGARKEKRRSQNYLDYEDLDDDLDKDDLAADDMIKDDVDKDDGASST